MVLGKFVKIVLGLQALIGVIVGIVIIISPAFLVDSGVQLESGGIFFIGIFVVVWNGIILAGLTKLHE